MEKRTKYEVWEFVESSPISAMLNENNARILVQRGELSGYNTIEEAHADLDRRAENGGGWNPKGCDITIIPVIRYFY